MTSMEMLLPFWWEISWCISFFVRNQKCQASLATNSIKRSSDSIEMSCWAQTWSPPQILSSRYHSVKLE